MHKSHRIARVVVVFLVAVVAGFSAVVSAEKEVRAEGPLLIRVERQTRDDVARLLSAGIPVVMEMRQSLFVEGKPDVLRRLDDQGFSSSILDENPASSDYLVIGLRPDSSMETLRAKGTLLHQEENWVLMRVPRGVSIEAVASEKVFVTRVPHQPLQAPQQARGPESRRGMKLADPDPLVQAIVDQVLPSSIDQLWADLTSNPPTGTRLSTHQGCRDAADYCYGLHDTLGLSVEYQEWSTSHAPNVVATQTGALYPEDVYIVIGHLDDLPTTPPAPGADDNATGSVTVLEAARVMSCYAFESTVKYLNVTGEESGLNGSEAYADDALARGEKILGVINMDMNGWEGDGSPDPENLDINYNGASEWLGLLFADCAQRYNTGLAVDAFYCPSLSASDHYPFWQNGWSAVCGITDNEGYCGHGGNYPYYHTSNDTIANCGDPAFFYSAVKASVATLAEMARPFKIITDRSSYACGAEIEILVGDRDLDTDPGIAESVVVEAWSDTEPTPESIALDERSASSMLFEGLVPTSLAPPVAGDGLVSVTAGDVVTIRYVDALDCDGATDAEYTAIAQIDCAAPLISNVAASGVTGAGATITWDTSEPADSLVEYGELAPGSSAADPALVTAHDVRLEGLVECTGYLFEVNSTDEAGNSASDDNLGSYYSFATGVNNQPAYDSSDTPIPIVDSGTISSTISVSEDDLVLDVKVTLNITHTYTGDLDITLISPTGTRVDLTSDNGGSGSNFTNTVFDDSAATPITAGSAPFTGSYQPEQPLAGATGISSTGDWTLEVVDDAGGDTGSLDDWTLTLTYPAQACGPSATYGAHFLEADVCATGAGNNNGFWDSGEQVQFSLSVVNDGTDPLTGVTAVVRALTPGVVMIDDTAAYGDIAEGMSALSAAPHYSAKLPTGLTCGSDIVFDVTISANEGGWSRGFTQVGGEVIPGGDAVAYFEDFEAAGIPPEWTIVDVNSDGFTWYTDNASDPAGCANTDPNPPIAGDWAAVDSDCTGSGVVMDEELISPLYDLTGIGTVNLEFDHWFNVNGTEKADLDVRSTLTGGLWVNVAQWVADTANPEHFVLDISAQAGNVADLQIRWHYYDADFEWYWYVDHVALTYPTTAECNIPECLGGPAGPPPIPDGGAGSVPMLADLLASDGSRISISWDDQCGPAGTKILYGSLDQVGSHNVSGAECGIGNPQVWDPVPAGDLWFVLVSDDGLGLESSWGLASSGERGGLSSSGTCGSTAKEISGTCP